MSLLETVFEHKKFGLIGQKWPYNGIQLYNKGQYSYVSAHFFLFCLVGSKC